MKINREIKNRIKIKEDIFFDKQGSGYGDITIFHEIFDIIEEPDFKENYFEQYFYELKRIRDLKNSFDTAREEGRKEGRNEESYPKPCKVDKLSVVKKMKSYNKVLTIAGSDSGGGAGIQADIKAISACKCFATSAITAITAQNTLGVTDIHPIPIVTIKKQIEAVLEDIGTDTVKIGMLHNSETILAVHEVLKNFNVTNIVLDPVMVSTSGSKLLEDSAISVLKTVLIPLVRVITPNIPEAEILLGTKLKNQDELPKYAQLLGKQYGVSALIKAGHLKDNDLIDVFYNKETDEILKLKSKRVFTKNTHGTGCTLSSAFASFLAKGQDLNTAVTNAKNYINKAIIEGKGYGIGKGHGAVKHFYNFWE